MTIIKNRYDFVLFFDVTNGNPNGDPDAGNMPRVDPETSHGLVSDVCIKRKIRNHVGFTREGLQGYEIYMAERSVLNRFHAEAYDAVGIQPLAKKKPKKELEARKITQWMCDNFFDVRTFGAVMTTEVNCGQVRGPVQIGFSRSVEQVSPLEVAITRSSVTNEKDVEKERTMGRKFVLPYGLYRLHGYVNAKLAEKTGFSEADLELLWTCFQHMFDLDRSAARGEMSACKLIAFRHDSPLGNARAQSLFDRVSVERVINENKLPVDDPRVQNEPPARSYKDYEISLDKDNLPKGVTPIELL